MAKKVTKKKTPTKKKTTTTKKRSAAKRTTKATKSVAAAPVTPTVTEEQIRRRAFEIWSAGVNPENPDADWLQAEHELRSPPAS